MKKAEDIILEIEPDSDGFQPYYRYDEVVKAIKQAQIDAIEEAVKRCAANADAGCDFGNMSMKRGNLFATFAGNIGKVVIDKQSILEVAEQLRKEIE